MAAGKQKATAQEFAFLAGDEEIWIQPKMRLDELQLFCGTIGEMQPGIPKLVPLWLAMYLKRRDKCRIKAPEWLEPDALEATLDQERNKADEFAPLPFHYLEIAKQILHIAEDDLDEPSKIRSLIADIEDNRRAKVQRGLQSLDESATSVRLNNVGAIELNCIREIAACGLDRMRSLDRGSRAGSDPTQPSQPSQPQQPQQATGTGGNERLASALRRRASVT